MSRSQTTALYTRVDNSFSNPVTGTTISPTDADTFFDDVESSVNSFIATSASSVAIGTGAKTFTVAADIANKVFIAGTFVHVYSRADTADYMFGTVTSYSTSTGALVLDITATGGSGTNTDWNISQAGARGATGATGTTGSTGGIRQAYSSTTTDADPGAGIFRLNHATPASATAAYLDNADAGGATVSTIWDLYDDSGSTVKGFIRFEKSSDATVWAQFQVTGSVVDGTGYRKLTLANGAGSGAFTNTDTFSIAFYRTGDPGALGGSTGATDNAALRADGVGGATVQASALIIADTTGSLSRSGNGGIPLQGTNTNDDAAAGYVGEYGIATLAYASRTSLTTATAKTVTSISIPAGDYDVTVRLHYEPAATTSITQYISSLSATDNTLDQSSDRALFTNMAANVPTTTVTQLLTSTRLSLASTTTYYAIARATFTVSTMQVWGSLEYRRVR